MMLEACEESKKAMLLANSSGDAARFCKDKFSTTERLLSSSHIDSIIGVCVGPGTKQLTLIPLSAKALAALLVKASTAPLLAA